MPFATFAAEQFAADLRAHRAKTRRSPYSSKGESVRGYAQRAGVSPSTLVRFEAATSTDLESYARLCAYMGCSMDYYFNSRTK